MSRDHRVIALDLRGHGDSDWAGEGKYKTEDYARDVSVSFERMGNMLSGLGRGEEALAYFQKALEIRERLAQMQPQNVEAQCDAACEARANVTATCTDPMVTIYARVGSPGMTARLNALVTSLQTNYPRILTAAARIERLTMTVPAFVQSLDGVARAAVNVGVQAVACTAQAVTVSAAAASKFNATVNVSVMFSASITATGTAQ
jgi:hypothetical protein